ncbi:LOW QUALITY PROTEIN: hypothetical protein V2J09_004402 [Rumex salicifolius]
MPPWPTFLLSILLRTLLRMYYLLTFFLTISVLRSSTKSPTVPPLLLPCHRRRPGTVGFANITDLKGRKVAFGAVDNGGHLNVAFVKSVKEIPYNIMLAHSCKVFADTLKGTDAEQTYLINLDGEEDGDGVRRGES